MLLVMDNSSTLQIFIDNLLPTSNWQSRAEHEDKPLLL